MPNTFGVTPLQKQHQKDRFVQLTWENKLQALTKTVVTFEYNAAQTRNLYHHVFFMNLGGLIAGFFYYLSPSEKLITYDRSNVT